MLSIDITDSEVRIVRIKAQGRRLRVNNAVSREISQGIVENGNIVDMFLLAGEITEILTAEKLPFEQTVICINAGGILYKELVLPKPRQINPVHLEEMISNEMGLNDSYNVTYSIVEEVPDEETGLPQLKIIATATPQRIVDSYIALAKHVGLPLFRMVVSSEIVSRLINKRPPDDNQSPLLLLQVDKNFININIYVNNNLVSSRYVQVNPDDYEASADPINLCIFDNIFRLIHFFGSAPGTEPIKHISYFGQVDDPKALESTLSQFNIPVSELGRPFELSQFKGFQFTRYVNCVAACYKIDKIKNDVDLLDSKEMRTTRQSMSFLAFAALVTLVLCFVVGGVTFFTNVLVDGEEATLNSAKSELEIMNHDDRVGRVALMKSAISNFERYVESVNHAKAVVDFQYNMTPDILSKLQEVMFRGMSIVGDVTVSEQTVMVSFNCAEEETPLNYVERLYEQGYFENIDYKGYQRTEEGYFAFTLSMNLKRGNIFET
ncbi:MAG: pilus assembly protein PilM [Oscillospiraceae bacterium]|nr:pilus assembly protein PilM [Oscillospiraceae bacterium]